MIQSVAEILNEKLIMAIKRPTLKSSVAYPKFSFNVGAGLDIPTGIPVLGNKGETIINGGLSQVTGCVGAGNSYKSTFIHYITATALDRTSASTPTIAQTYDTEINLKAERIEELTKNTTYLVKDDITNPETGQWLITDKSIYGAEEWMTMTRNYLEGYDRDKLKNSEKLTTPFLLKDKNFKISPPNFIEVDSLTEFETTTTMELIEDADLGDKSTNTLFMKQGLVKTKFLMELPRLSNNTNAYFLLTAHVGQELNMASGPFAPQPAKKLAHLKGGNKIKGVSDKFYFLTSCLWHVYSVTPMINQSDKKSLYPKKGFEDYADDLNLLKIRQLRSKTGSSGYSINIIVSQSEGVLPSLTEFYNLKKDGNNFGMSGTGVRYHLDIYPDVTLMRTTIRDQTDKDPKLRRALNITNELYQISIFWRQAKVDGLLCTAKELYDDIKALGYDWDVILETRGWWTYDQYNKKLPNFLSTMDLLKMRKGLYTPYWYKK